ncbi:MAG: glycosyltransferase family 4 protein [Bacteroidota bacterium]|nr:glycosyltransferase family 4 protein [Bacteroidota bacterium]
MKRLLIITYYWPPSGGSGVQRWLKFVKYLRQFGWEPVVYTPENPELPEADSSLEKDIPQGIEIIRRPIWEPYMIYKRLAGLKKDEKLGAGFVNTSKKPGRIKALSLWIRGNLLIPDPRCFWINPSVSFLTRYLETHPVDAIVSTGPPHSMHRIAFKLHRETQLPWLADFRDPWTNIDFYKELRLSAFADRIHHRMELQVLKEADRITVIGPHMKTDFKQLLDRPYHVITNGFDPDDTGQPVAIQPKGKFSISHIGTMAASRNPVSLWKALQKLSQELPGFKDDLQICLSGNVDIIIIECIRASGLEPCLKKIDYLPHDEVVDLQKNSAVLLLQINNTPNARMILPGKFFEYMASGRPILCIGPGDGDAAAIIQETGCGLTAGFDDVELIQKHLATLYAAYKNGDLIVSPAEINRFSRPELTRSLAALLNEMTAGTKKKSF